MNGKARQRCRALYISYTSISARDQIACAFQRLNDACVCYMVFFHLVTAAAALGTIIKRAIMTEWRTFYGSGAVLKSPRDCTMLGSSMRCVGLVDITAGNATPLGASQRSATRRCASQHIATQRLSRWGSPAARGGFVDALKPLWLRDACRSQPEVETEAICQRGTPASPAHPHRPVHAGGSYFGGCKSPRSQRPSPLDVMGSSNAAKLVST